MSDLYKVRSLKDHVSLDAQPWLESEMTYDPEFGFEQMGEQLESILRRRGIYKEDLFQELLAIMSDCADDLADERSYTQAIALFNFILGTLPKNNSGAQALCLAFGQAKDGMLVEKAKECGVAPSTLATMAARMKRMLFGKV